MPQFTLVRSRRKTTAIYILPNGRVEVRAPKSVSSREIDRFVQSKSVWIAKKLAELERRATVPAPLPDPVFTPETLRQTVCGLAERWADALGVSVSYIGLRSMTSRWGSCTPKTRRIRISTALLYAPAACVEYVVVHELAHILQQNHSPGFWKIVADALPDYKARKKQLTALQRQLSAAGIM
ncbi:MAG: M48 family metallopeptidase [Oscillospiraceae bacterium]|nr:M48 family metallopeptidase [Oscillospiraceae bacterium]